MQTKFKELTWPVRVGVIGGWVIIVVYVVSFLIGFIGGLMSL